MISAQDALKNLREGNARFASASQDHDSPEEGRHYFKAVDRQEPFAIILGCSDSRVPPEVVFDQGIGELFVVRVAGNIVTPTQIGSIEFAVKKFDTRLVVVLGHTMCGAIQATLEDLQTPMEPGSGNLPDIVNCIKPSVEAMLKNDLQEGPESLQRQAMRNNVLNSVHQLQQQSTLLRNQIDHEGLKIIGAEYCVSSGAVDFLAPEAN